MKAPSPPRLPIGTAPRMSVRIEAVNALNYQALYNPDTSPRSSTSGYDREIRDTPRDLQFGIRWMF